MATKRRVKVKVEPKYHRVLAIDLGNGLVNIRSIDSEGEAYRVTYPSAFAYAKNVGESVNNNDLDLDIYEIDKIEYVWGEDITKVNEIIPTYGHQNRYKSEAFKTMAKIAMTKAVYDLDIQPKEKILLVTGVPSAETGTDSEEDMAEAFYGDNKGVHKIGINDCEVMFTIADVEVTGQALATVLGRYLDVNGNVEDEDYEEMKVGVIDIGGGTTDLDVVHALRRQKANDSVPKGFHDIYDSIRTVIRKTHITQHVSDYELLDIMQDVAKNMVGKTQEEKLKVRYTYKPSRRAEEVDFTKALYDGVEELGMAIQTAIMSKWKNNTDLDEVLVVGGSAEMFRSYVEEIISGITIPPNNGESNVEGYYRLGMYIIVNGDEE